MGTKRVFTKEFKEQAVELADSPERRLSEVAHNSGIGLSTLCRWKRGASESAAGALRAFPGKGKVRDEELSRLRKENADLRETNGILKKAMVIFTAESPR
jgi:transposase